MRARRRASASSPSTSASSACVVASINSAAFARRRCAASSVVHSSGASASSASSRARSCSASRSAADACAAVAAASRRSMATRQTRQASRDVARQWREAAERVEQRALRLGAHERLVRVLAVQVEELRAELAQLRERRRPAVDPGAAAALRVQHAAQQQLVARVELRGFEPARDRRQRGDVEHRRQLRALGPRRAAAAVRSGRRAAGRARRAGSTCRRPFRR